MLKSLMCARLAEVEKVLPRGRE